jgi:hypothetical protein
MANRPSERITSTTPPGFERITKSVKIARTDTTAFEAFVVPKGAVLSGSWVIGQTASDAGTTATISVGSNPGTTNEFLAAFDVKGSTGAGFNAAGAKQGTSLGTQLTADTLIKAKYTETGTASTTGGDWLVLVEYYFPQPGNSW